MSQLRFNHVFSFLMLLAALAAFVIPQHISAPAQAQLSVLFLPISRPIYSLAEWAHHRAVSATPARDEASPDQPRSPDELIRENTSLRQQNLMLTAEMDKLQQLDAEWAPLGDLRERCSVAAVTGRDSALRDSLLISGGSLQGFKQGMAVLSTDGLIGRLDKVGAASSIVRLIWDKGNKMDVSFARFQPDGQGGGVWKDIKYPHAVAKGLGDGELDVQFEMLDKLKDVFKVNDIAVLDDPDWPKSLLHYRIGDVTEINPQAGAVGFGEIRIQSRVGVGELKEVMVLVK